jgi:hypothetical protein
MKVGDLCVYVRDYSIRIVALQYDFTAQGNDTFLVLNTVERPHHQFGDMRIKAWCNRRNRICLLRKGWIEVISECG